MTLYAPYAVRYETDAMAGTPALLGGITQQSIATGSDESQEAVAGSHYPLWLGLTGQKIVGEFTTLNIQSALTNLLPPASVLTGAAFQLWQIKKTAGAVVSGSVHRHVDIIGGVIVPQRLSVPADGNAELSYQVLAQFDGTNDPMSFTESAALPAETLADPQRWAMGPLQIGAVALDGNTNVEIDFGVKADQIQADGDVWAQYIDVSDYLAKITIRSVDTSQVSAAGIPLTGKVGTVSNSHFYLRQRDDGGFTAGANHIKCVFDGLVYADDVWDAKGNSRGECSLVCLLRYDGSNAPITFTFSQALP